MYFDIFLFKITTADLKIIFNTFTYSQIEVQGTQ